MKYDLLNCFDVWGNETDGFEVNDQSTIESNIELKDISNKALLAWLIDNDYIKNTATLDDIEFSSDSESYINISEKSNNFPLFVLREIYE